MSPPDRTQICWHTTRWPFGGPRFARAICMLDTCFHHKKCKPQQIIQIVLLSCVLALLPVLNAPVLAETGHASHFDRYGFVQAPYPGALPSQRIGDDLGALYFNECVFRNIMGACSAMIESADHGVTPDTWSKASAYRTRGTIFEARKNVCAAISDYRSALTLHAFPGLGERISKLEADPSTQCETTTRATRLTDNGHGYPDYLEAAAIHQYWRTVVFQGAPPNTRQVFAIGPPALKRSVFSDPISDSVTHFVDANSAKQPRIVTRTSPAITSSPDARTARDALHVAHTNEDDDPRIVAMALTPPQQRDNCTSFQIEAGVCPTGSEGLHANANAITTGGLQSVHGATWGETVFKLTLLAFGLSVLTLAAFLTRGFQTPFAFGSSGNQRRVSRTLSQAIEPHLQRRNHWPIEIDDFEHAKRASPIRKPANPPPLPAMPKPVRTDTPEPMDLDRSIESEDLFDFSASQHLPALVTDAVAQDEQTNPDDSTSQSQTADFVESVSSPLDDIDTLENAPSDDAQAKGDSATHMPHAFDIADDEADDASIAFTTDVFDHSDHDKPDLIEPVVTTDDRATAITLPPAPDVEVDMQSPPPVSILRLLGTAVHAPRVMRHIRNDILTDIEAGTTSLIVVDGEGVFAEQIATLPHDAAGYLSDRLLIIDPANADISGLLNPFAICVSHPDPLLARNTFNAAIEAHSLIFEQIFGGACVRENRFALRRLIEIIHASPNPSLATMHDLVKRDNRSALPQYATMLGHHACADEFITLLTEPAFQLQLDHIDKRLSYVLSDRTFATMTSATSTGPTISTRLAEGCFVVLSNRFARLGGARCAAITTALLMLATFREPSTEKQGNADDANTRTSQGISVIHTDLQRLLGGTTRDTLSLFEGFDRSTLSLIRA